MEVLRRGGGWWSAEAPAGGSFTTRANTRSRQSNKLKGSLGAQRLELR